LSHRCCFLSLSWKSWNRFECAVVGVRHVTHFIYIWKLLYMFRLVPPPIIRSAYNCIYSIWNSSTIVASSSNGVTNISCCKYSCMRSWWWVGVSPEICRAVSRYK
jgi:hypothetical protein